MDRPALMAIVLAFLALLLLLMYLGWRARRRRQNGVAAPAAAPAELGTIIGTIQGKYVATTISGDPLDRVVVHGLGFRGTVLVLVAEAGILLQFAGSELWIPAADLLDVRRATWTIDRVVEQDGLHLIQWRLGDTEVDSYFRMTEATAFDDALARLMAERKPA